MPERRLVPALPKGRCGKPLVLASLIAAASTLTGQEIGLVNGGFEKGVPGAMPPPWQVTLGSAAVVTDGCREGAACVEVMPGPGSDAASPGILLQSLDAAAYRGKLVRYRAAVRVADAGRAGLWLRVDRADRRTGFFENMSARPIFTQQNWRYFEINGFVDADATRISLGLLAYSGRALLDDASLEITGDMPVMTEEPPRPLTGAALDNLVALAKLYGIVRHFHPSDEAAAADWNLLAIAGARRVEGAAAASDLAGTLQDVFEPVAPTIRVYTGAEPPRPAALAPAGDAQLTRWHNIGFATAGSSGPYRRDRPREPGSAWKASDIYGLDLGRGVRALVPLAVFADAAGTLPHRAAPAEPVAPFPAGLWSAGDRATRIGDVIMAWNVFRHFYPYFDVVGTDWNAVLEGALRKAATDRSGAEFCTTLRKMVAELKDGHGRVTDQRAAQPSRVPIAAEWIEGRLVVTGLAGAAAGQVKAGDEIVGINGKPAAAALEDAETLTSGATPQWKRVRSTYEVLSGPSGQVCELTVRPTGGTANKGVRLTYAQATVIASDPRPTSAVVELEPGIWYVDVTRARDKDVDEALPTLVQAKGIVFDMRGYPRVTPIWLQHLTTAPMRSAQWHVPVVDRPGEMTFIRGGEWNLVPLQPYLAAKKVFLTNGGAISYAESTMGIVEHYKLGEIVGETTAGTNGNVNPFELPGGFSMTWTGMKVLKQDGSQHHGVGIAPTVPAARTQAGVAAGRDEVLERGVAILKQ
jgi:C-terminal processing protease CtpA/Prc